MLWVRNLHLIGCPNHLKMFLPRDYALSPGFCDTCPIRHPVRSFVCVGPFWLRMGGVLRYLLNSFILDLGFLGVRLVSGASTLN